MLAAIVVATSVGVGGERGGRKKRCCKVPSFLPEERKTLFFLLSSFLSHDHGDRVSSHRLLEYSTVEAKTVAVAVPKKRKKEKAAYRMMLLWLLFPSLGTQDIWTPHTRTAFPSPYPYSTIAFTQPLPPTFLTAAIREVMEKEEEERSLSDAILRCYTIRGSPEWEGRRRFVPEAIG